MTTVFTNIKLLVNTREKSELLYGRELQSLPCVENAYLVVEDDEIADFGPMSKFTGSRSGSNSIECLGKMILPCWCDSHTHVVFAESREQEFLDKIKGLSYAEIAAKGGGIINSAGKLQETSEDELFNQAWKRLEELAKLGTGAVEIKSGYGLTTEAELKMLRVIKKLRERSNLFVKSTFLGAHTYPPAYKEDHEGYIDLILNEMLPAIAAEKLADYIDVFCENGFFSVEQTDTICRAG
ncbi:MAG TPA: imidazolonepropionase, partial [Flavitalea sp.]|nr:imidazolonepropionase [Flavitalea sp.]